MVTSQGVDTPRSPLRAPSTQLSLQQLRILVRLGCSAEERLVPQYVSFDVQIRFYTPPEGCFTDALEQTVCYAELSQTIKSVCERQEYQLIEKLGWDVYTAVRNFLPQPCLLRVSANKEHPPVAHLEGGATFTVSDWDQGSN